MILTILNLLLGLAILVKGLANGRKAAIYSGAALLLFVAWDVALTCQAIRGGSVPEIRIDLVLILPVSIVLWIVGARALRGPEGKRPSS